MATRRSYGRSRPQAASEVASTSDYLGRPQADSGTGGYLSADNLHPPAPLPPPAAPPSSEGNTYHGGFTYTTSPGNMLAQNRMNIEGQGQALLDQTGRSQDYFSHLNEGYRQAADTAYTDLAKNPGYSPDIAGKIGVDYSQFNTPDAALQDQYLTPGEQSGIRGDPNAAFKYFDPGTTNKQAGAGADAMWNVADQAAGYYGSAADQEAQWLSGNIDREGLQLDPAYGQKVGGILGQSRSDLTGALDKAGTGARGAISDAAGGIGGYLGQEGESLNSAVNDKNLALSGDFLPKYQMSDADVQDTVNQASRSVGTRYQNEQDELLRNAAANGNASPLAIAAARTRLQQQEGVQSADAETNARIAAKAQQAQRLLTGEQTRLGATQTQAGMRTQAAEALGQQGVQSEEYLGGLGAQTALQLGAENVGAGEYLGNAGLNATSDVEGKRLGAKQYLTGTLESAAAKAGDTYLSAIDKGTAARENALQSGTDARLQAGEYGQTLGTNLGLQTEAEQQQREAALAGNRQATTAGINQTRYAQGTGSAQATAAGATNVGQTALGGQQQYRGYLTGQEQQAQQGQLTSSGQQIQGFGVQSQGTNQAAGAQVQNMGTGTSPAQYLQAISGFFAEGGIVDEPTEGIIGERGPELVIPIGPRKIRRYGVGKAA